MPVATLPITVERADADGVVIRPAGAYPDKNVQVTWATLRAAADQDREGQPLGATLE